MQTKVHYNGSYFWLIFFLIVFFPIAFVLLFTNSSIQVGDTYYHFQYAGSRFWLCFWMLVFFPVAFVLLLTNGFNEPKKLVIPRNDKKNGGRGGSCGTGCGCR